ncbi:MAG: M28 family peptidase [Ignavibacteriae bacterium]|nr:M28 family peptidase [Ignavibacteriota bacterium]
MKKSLLLTLFIVLPRLVLAQSTASDLTDIKTNMEYLASDELMGRETATDGEKIASDYIAKKLMEYGVKPFGDNGTYFQNYPLIQSRFLPGSKVKIYHDGKTAVYSFGKDFIIDARRNPDPAYLNKKSKMVFAGFGISAPEYNYDDYSALDITGKTVFVLDDEPLSNDSTWFRGERATQYSFWGTKWRQARERGATGLVIIATDGTMDAWGRLSAWGEGSSIRYPDTSTSSGRNRIPVICVSPEMAKKLLKDEEYSYEELERMFNEREKIPVFAMDKEIDFMLENTEEEVISRNVVGIIEGTDPVLKNEYVSLGGHYDHLGNKTGVVYNGADDNASGTVTVMDIAKRFAYSNENKRSIVVMLYSGEEEGLMGSRYASEHLPFIKDMVANINMDMVGRMSEDSLSVIGASRLSTELGELVEEVNGRTSNFIFDYTFDAPDDPNRFYERSDHYNFARFGIPIVFFFDNMESDYHKPTDDFEKINYAKIQRTSDLAYELALVIANLDHKLTVDKQN